MPAASSSAGSGNRIWARERLAALPALRLPDRQAVAAGPVGFPAPPWHPARRPSSRNDRTGAYRPDLVRCEAVSCDLAAAHDPATKAVGTLACRYPAALISSAIHIPASH